MGLISTTIPNLVNGVSQQPDSLRLASQCEEQINGYSSVVDGLSKRTGSKHIARLGGVVDASFIHMINRDTVEQYTVVIQGGDLKVFDLTGVEKTVTFPQGKSYLTSVNPDTDFRCITVADYTFALNTTVTVLKDVTTTTARPNEALVWVKQGSYGAKYTLFVNNFSGTYTVPNGSVATDAALVTTDNIAERLRVSLVANMGSSSSLYTVTRLGSTLYIKRVNSADFTIRADDSLSDNGLKTIKGQVQRFSDLPSRGVEGFTVEIVGDQSSTFDNYYVKYDTTASGATDGVWKESVKAGELDSFLHSTLPHALIRQADGTFTFGELTWDKRLVGDLVSNPFPSFTDRKLNDIFFHRNRLGFLADENVIFSRAGKFFNFFNGTSTAILDDDPIDIGVSHTKVSILRHAIPFNETILFFSDQTQFQLAQVDTLTPNTVAINQTTEYECSLKAKPVGVGRYVYFAVNRGSFTGIREYYADGQTEAEDAEEVTGHVPRYIPTGCFKIAASSNEDILAVLAEGSRNEIFIYKYYWSGNEKLQSSWSRWTFAEGDKVLNCEFIESRLFVVIARADGVHLEVINIESAAVEENWTIQVRLDSKVNHTQTTNTFFENNAALELDDVTHIELPYRIVDPTQLQLITAPLGTLKEGVIVPVVNFDNTGVNTILYLQGNWTTQPFFVGKPFRFSYKFSTLLIKEEAVGGGQMAISEGRLQLRKAALQYNNTGFFIVTVTPFRRDTYTYTFSGRVVGSAKNLLGKVSLESGQFTFPIAAKNDLVEIEIINDTFLPSFFLSAEWEAFYSIRSKRI